MNEYGPQEHVYVENEWYDGPRAGIADVNGIPNRFKSLFDEAEDEYLGTFLVWPVDLITVELEQEQWRIFAVWNALYEAGKATIDTHPGHGGKNARWDEIEALLAISRTNIPQLAQHALAKLTHFDGDVRYPSSGPAYTLSWRLL
ncbi:MAG: hypothetical protein RSA22_02140 [Acinetobacter sp.]|jgi:hypothetical protein